MQIFWYIDVTERQGSATEQDADIAPPPPYEGLAPATFTVGPIKFNKNEKLSVVQFINRIQLAFTQAYETEAAPRLYQIKARVRSAHRELGWQDSVKPTAMSADMAASLAQARQNQELIIEYVIFTEDPDEQLPEFTLMFHSGPHGSDGGLQAEQGIIVGPPIHGQQRTAPIAEVSVINEPEIKGISTLHCTIPASITDRPPMPPDVRFIPYVGVNNQLLVLFNSNGGQGEARPIILKNSDIGFVVDEYFSQHGIEINPATLTNSEGVPVEKIQYRNDDPVRKYELFRINQKPTSYEDFVGQNRTDEPIQIELAPGKFSTAPAFIDSIVPNQKYWYCARSIDIHNNISNPTYIFEVEMVDNRGQLFLITKIFNFEPKQPIYRKPGRRYMAIRPTLNQSIYNSEIAPPTQIGLNLDPGDNLLGDEEVRSTSPVWGKVFKIRLISRQTGRKLDLNVTFKNEGVENV